MRLAIEVDNEVYDFYKEEFKNHYPQPREALEGAMLIYDTETKKWTWAFLNEAPNLDIDLLYAAPPRGDRDK